MWAEFENNEVASKGVNTMFIKLELARVEKG